MALLSPPCPNAGENDNEEDLFDVKKRLYFETPALDSTTTGPKALGPVPSNNLVVYLRVRPKSQLEILRKDPDCLHVLPDQREVTAIPPRNLLKNFLTQNFTFTNIFDASSTQKLVFEETMLPVLKDFFEGQNCLLFSYGVTNSGKSYTITGTSSEPGLLPRSLDVIFNSLESSRFSSLSIKPKRFSEVVFLSEEEEEEEATIKKAILDAARQLNSHLPPPPPPPAGTSSTAAATDADEHNMSDDTSVSVLSKASSICSKASEDGEAIVDDYGEEFQVHDESSIEISNHEKFTYSLWISFAEIYNEFIYDLLSDNLLGKRRVSLKLSQDKNQNFYIKGLREVRVESVEEALSLLRLGLQNRHVAGTRLNYNSSRSHSIYTIKLLRMTNSDRRPTHTLVNRISIVDLAGAERTTKTGATGMRVKEAGNINTSLLTLGRCIAAMRHNQNKTEAEEELVPYRNSKLTRLFQNYLVGKGYGARRGRVAMMVNVSNNASVYSETMHVFKFSAIASKVIPQVKPGPATEPSSSSSSSQQPMETALPARASAETNSTSCDTCDHRALHLLEEQVKGLEDQLKEHKAREVRLKVDLRTQESKIRKEVWCEFSEQLCEIEEKHSQELEEQEVELSDMYEQRMKLLQKSVKKAASRKRRRQDDSDDGSDHLAELDACRKKIKELQQELDEERTRAAAELRDTSETHQSHVVKLNQQANALSVKLSSAQQAQAAAEKEREQLKGKLNEQHQKAASELSAVVGDLKKSTDLLAAREIDYASLQEELKKRSKDLETWNRKYTLLQQELDRANQQLLERQEVNVEVQVEIDEEEEEILEARISELTKEVEALQSQLEEKEVLWNQSRAELLNRFAAEKMELVNCFAAEKEKLKGCFAAEKEELEGCLAAELEGRFAAEKESLQSQFATERECMRNEMAAFEKEKLLQQASEDELKAQHSDVVRQTVAELQAQHAAMLKQLSKEKAAEKAKAIEALEGKLEQLQEQHAAMLKQLSEEKAAEKAKAIEALEGKLEQLQAQHAAMLKQLSEEKAAEKAKAMEALEGKLEQLQAQHAAMLEEKGAEKAKAEEALEEKLAAHHAAMLVKLSEDKEAEKAKALDKEKRKLEKLQVQHAAMMEKLDEKEEEYAELRGDVQGTIQGYEQTLLNQKNRIGELEAELQEFRETVQELEDQRAELELRLERAGRSKDSLSLQVEQLTEKLDDSHRVLSQREAELLDSLDQCRGVMEGQVADLKKHSATQEHRLCSSQEEVRSLQEQLREKMAGEVGACRELSLQLEALKEEQRSAVREREALVADLEEHHCQLDTLKGNHQLEVAQLSIKVRELSEQLSVKSRELENASVSYEHEVEVAREQSRQGTRALEEQTRLTETQTLRWRDTEQQLAGAQAEIKKLNREVKRLEKEVENEKRMKGEAKEEHKRAAEELSKKLHQQKQDFTKERFLMEKNLQAMREDNQLLRKKAQASQALLPHSSTPAKSPSNHLPAQKNLGPATCTSSNLTLTPKRNLHPPSYAISPKPAVSSMPPQRDPTYEEIPSFAPQTADDCDLDKETDANIYDSVASEKDRGVFQSLENTLDRSKPYLPVLESSSQLVESIVVEDPDRIVIDATPGKKKKGTKRKRKEEPKEKESPQVRTRAYNLRSCRKQSAVKYTESPLDEKKTPKVTKIWKKLTGSSKKKENVPVPAAKKKTLTVRKKSLISLPMALIDSPETRKNQVSLGHKIPGSKRFKYNIS